MLFEIKSENQFQDIETYSFEVKVNVEQKFYKVSVTRGSFVKLCVAKHGTQIHCGLIVRNDFQVENKKFKFFQVENKKFKFLVVDLLPHDNISYIRFNFCNTFESCKDTLKKVFPNNACGEDFLSSEEILCTTGFQVIKNLVTNSCNEKFICDMSQKKPQDWVEGMNCLKFMDMFCRDFKVTIPLDFKEKLTKTAKTSFANNTIQEIQDWISFDTETSWNYLCGRF
jgi:hypothetical protein